MKKSMLALTVCVFIFLPQNDSRNLQVGKELFDWVRGIEGKSHEGRRDFIKKQLKEMGVEFHTMRFDTTLRWGERSFDVSGENITVTVGKGTKRVVVGAHCDAVPGSPGANDNGGGVAVVLGLIKHLKGYAWNFTVDFCFFDQEEAGLVGSMFYVQRYHEKKNHLAMINLDVEGTGNEIYVGPVGGGDDNLIMRYVREAREKTKFHYEENEIYPGSDYQSFADAKLENISISVVPKGDVEKLVKWTKTGFKKIENPQDTPEVLKVMHSPHDSSSYMSPYALGMSYEFTKTVLILLNEASSK